MSKHEKGELAMKENVRIGIEITKGKAVLTLEGGAHHFFLHALKEMNVRDEITIWPPDMELIAFGICWAQRDQIDKPRIFFSCGCWVYASPGYDGCIGIPPETLRLNDRMKSEIREAIADIC